MEGTNTGQDMNDHEGNGIGSRCGLFGEHGMRKNFNAIYSTIDVPPPFFPGSGTVYIS
jgi:hypothetical protein